MVQYSATLPDIYQNFGGTEVRSTHSPNYIHILVFRWCRGSVRVWTRQSRQLSHPGWLLSVCAGLDIALVQISLKVLLQEFTWKGETGGDTSGNGRGTRCTNQNNAPDKDVNYALEKYGRNSRCLLQVNKFTMTLKLFIMTTYRPSPGRRSPAQCWSSGLGSGPGVMSTSVQGAWSMSSSGMSASLAPEQVWPDLMLLIVTILSQARRSLWSWYRGARGERPGYTLGVSSVPGVRSSVGSVELRPGRDRWPGTWDLELDNVIMFQDFYKTRESLGDCFREAEKDASNLLIGFLKEFGAGDFNFG